MKIMKLIIAVTISLIIYGCGGGSSQPINITTSENMNINYKFDEAAGSIAYNSAGDFLNGSIFGAERVTGFTGNALRFSNNGSYVELNVLEFDEWTYLNNSITIEAYVYFDFINNLDTYHFFGDQDFGVKSFRIIIRNSNFVLQFYSNNAWIDVIESNFTFNLNTWYKITLTYDQSTAKFYVDNILDTQAGFISSLPTFANRIYLGGLDPASVNLSFPGIIDEFTFN